MDLAGRGPDDFAHVDLYSCFPSAVQIGAEELGFGLDRDLTVTGGLCFAGGPWNNYVTHSIATMVERVRDEPGSFGFVSANGGYVTKHAFGVYSTTPPADGLRTAHPQDEVDALPSRELAEDWQGEATVEGYTVMHDRDGNPETAFAACLLADGRRTWAVGHDAGVAQAMTEGEWVGEKVRIGPEAELVACPSWFSWRDGVAETRTRQENRRQACITTSNSSNEAPCATGEGRPASARCLRMAAGERVARHPSLEVVLGRPPGVHEIPSIHRWWAAAARSPRNPASSRPLPPERQSASPARRPSPRAPRLR